MQKELSTPPNAQLVQRCAADERAGLDLFWRAIEQRDELAWALIEQQWKGHLLRWLFQHPAARVALEQGSPESYASAALSKLWQATTHSQRPRPAFSTLAGVLAYLRSCLNSVVLDAVREAQARQHEVYGAALAENVGSQPVEVDLWQCIEQALPKRQERWLVYLRYVQGYRPREIVATYPEAFPYVGKVYQMERNILERLRRHPALARWRKEPA
jgi:DNA-directed RNA polymerase specialized sigma24 family protein